MRVLCSAPLLATCALLRIRLQHSLAGCDHPHCASREVIDQFAVPFDAEVVGPNDFRSFELSPVVHPRHVGATAGRVLNENQVFSRCSLQLDADGRSWSERSGPSRQEEGMEDAESCQG